MLPQSRYFITINTVDQESCDRVLETTSYLKDQCISYDVTCTGPTEIWIRCYPTNRIACANVEKLGFKLI